MPLQQSFFRTSWSMDIPDVDPLRLGFIGAGDMASFSVLPALHFAEIDLRAVCDLDRDRAQLMAAKFGAPAAYQDYRAMIDSEDLEAVVVQLQPGQAREQLARDCLDAGLHVFMPKPPTCTYADAVALADYARAAGRQIMVNFESRFSYAVRTLRDIMADPEFGRPTQAHFSFCSGSYRDRLDTRHGSPYRDTVHAYLLDFTPHHLDLARYLCGEVTSAALFHNEIDGESANALTLRFADGTVGTMQLTSNRIWWRNYDRIEITGQGQYAIAEDLWHVRRYTRQQNTFTENYRDERSGELTGDGFALREFVAAIRENREPVASIADCTKTMELYHHLYTAVRENRDGVIIPEPHAANP